MRLPLKHAQVDYCNFLETHEATYLKDELMKIVNLSSNLFEGRLTALYGDENTVYSYAKNLNVTAQL